MTLILEEHQTPELIIHTVLGRTDYAKPSVRECSPARVFHVKGNGSYGWARAVVQSWKEGGSIDIQSDLGSYSNYWGSIGDQNIYAFLRSLDFHYFMEKTTDNQYMVFDEEGSVQTVKEYIISARRETKLSKETARSLWDDMMGWERSDCSHTFYEQLCEVDQIYELFPDGDFPNCEKPTYQSQLFWNGPWQALCKHWKEQAE